VGLIRAGSSRRPSARSRIAFLLAAIVLVLILGCGALCLSLRDRGTVFPGVSIAGKPVSGLTRQAALRVAQSLCPRPDAPVALELPGTHLRRTVRDLGLSFHPETAADAAYALGRRGSFLSRIWTRVNLRRRPKNLPLAFEMQRPMAERTLGQIAANLPKIPGDATALLESDGKVRIVPERFGLALKSAESLRGIEAWARKGARGPVRLAAAATAPRIKAQDLRPVTSVIARFSTPLGSSSANRRHNIRLATASISGFVLMPGDVFSYDAVVGQRTAKEGYRLAPVIQGGRLVPGAGGGACQVSSTLYNAALLSGMEIVQRSHHSQPVSYLPPGRDAAVWWGVFELKFRNPTDSPMVLQGSVGARFLTFLVLGKPGGPRISVYSTHRRGRWARPIMRADHSLPPGKTVVEREGKPAVFATVVRQIGESPGASRQIVSRDYYHAVPAIVRLGPPAPAATEPEPAVPVEPPAPPPGGPPEPVPALSQ